MAKNDPRSTPKRAQEASKRFKKASPNRKTKKGPNQDDPRAALDPPSGRYPQLGVTQGRHLGPLNDTKTDPKRIKN